MDEIIERLNFYISFTSALEQESSNKKDEKTMSYFFGKRMAYEEIKQMLLKIK